MKITRAGWLAVIFLAAQAGDCGAKSAPRGKGFNLIIISMSNIGAEHMSLYGYARKTTPRLDAWARKAFVFDTAFTNASWTLPVAASLFTSLHPYAHKLTSRVYSNRLNAAIPTLPQILKESGYQTAAFAGGLDYNPIFGQMRGFDVVADNLNFTRFKVTLAQAKTWLSQKHPEKFLLFVHGYDAHCPFAPSGRFKGAFGNADPRGLGIAQDPPRCIRGYRSSDNAYQAEFTNEWCKGLPDCRSESIALTQKDIDFMRDRYDETVLETDTRIADFLSSLNKNVLKRTIIIIFSDHGEMFAKHGRFGRAGIVRGTFYEDVIHVPLIVKLPEGPGGRVSGLAEIVDVMPTVLDVLGLPAPKVVQGTSLLPALAGRPLPRSWVHAGLPFYRWRSDQNYVLDNVAEYIRGRRWKLIREVYQSTAAVSAKATSPVQDNIELYDLENDPQELKNVAGLNPEIVADLKERLRLWAKRTKALTPASGDAIQLPPSFYKTARMHGYW